MTPVITTALDRAFGGASDFSKYMPHDIPKEYPNKKLWHKFQSDWFFRGINTSGLIAKPGIDKATALGHLAVINGSFEPKHEDKVEAVAYLASLWFEPTSTWQAVK